VHTPGPSPTPSPDWLKALQEALLDFAGRQTRAANRMVSIQRLLMGELETRFVPLGELAEVRPERIVKGKHRAKNWDVTFSYARRPQLAISTKSIMANVAGTVPNRIDDAMGECVNVHAHDPGMVLGYLFVMDAAGGQQLARSGQRWVDILAESLVTFSGRRSERDAYELFEAATLLLVDFSSPLPQVTFHPRLLGWVEFFDVLVGHVRARHSLIDLPLGRGA
jgi:hypothetical protein